MEELINHIRKKVEELLNEKVDYINKIENVPNNSVYKVFVKNKPYIFKIYKQRTWPEEGKLIFVNKKLIENNIGCAKIIAFDRNDSYFHTGFLLEECLPGENADHIVFDPKSGKGFYKKFAFDKNSLLEIKKMVIDRLRLCESLPSVLCHGDLSTKNVMIDEHGDLTLIDWDDAMSYNWIADISRMTYWMKIKYNDYEYELYRNTFMEHYSTERTKSDINVFENIFHVWIGLDYLNYFANTPQYEDTMTHFKEAMEKLNK